MRRIGFALAVLLMTLAAQARGEGWYDYEWPCNGAQYGNTPLIYEEAFPGSHPGTEVLRSITFTTQMVSHRRRERRTAVVDAVVILVNRRENRPFGFTETLLHTVHGISTGSPSTLTIPTWVKLIEGDMVKVGIICTPVGKKVPKRVPSVKFSIDFTGKEYGYED